MDGRHQHARAALRRARAPISHSCRSDARIAAPSPDRRRERAWYQRRAQPRRPPQRGNAADAVLHAGAGSAGVERGADVDQLQEFGWRRQLLEHPPRLVRAQLLDRVAAGRHRNRAHADGVGALDVVRRVADDEHVLLGARGRLARASSSARVGDRGAGARVLGKRAVRERSR